VFSNDQPLLQYYNRKLGLTGGQRLAIYNRRFIGCAHCPGQTQGQVRLEQLLEQHRALAAGQLTKKLAIELDRCDGDHLPDDVALITMDF
jgi:hypothetical protein